jgi:hypothetical protein
MRRIRARHLVSAALLALAGTALPVHGAAPGASGPIQRPAAVSNIDYLSNHPRLLYTTDEIPALYAKVRDGGYDDTAYSFIRLLIQYIYPGASYEELLDGYFAVSTIPILGMGSVLQSPPDPAPREKGRSLTLYIADNWGPDSDAFMSALRLRALALGYDMFLEQSAESEREYIRSEILSYIDRMLEANDYEVWSLRPYLGNYSAMVASALGLAAISLDGEIDPAIVASALKRADDIIRVWLTYPLDEDGAYNEGTLYGSWSLRHLVYYFWARYRYDGYDYSENPRIRNMENWFAYELHPDGAGKVNNIQDCAYSTSPLSENTTYFDWAMTMWGSRLSAYIWEHVAGVYGYNAGDNADKAGTVLWNQKLPVEYPQNILPKSAVWGHRGLYYFRTGWPAGASSSDVVFSFYSGEFQGGHAQEDQNQFTLQAYGAKFAVDHGLGTTAIQGEAHNMVFIDGAGQHAAGASIGTDGALARYVRNGYCDYLVGDATGAYTTHSPLNNYGVPLPDTDWSWGYVGANPVDHAYRSVFVVRDPATPPYFLVIDDIEKDGSPHTYEWRLHTGRSNTVDASANPIRISSGSAVLDLHVVNPAYGTLTKSVTAFNNNSPDPDSWLISLGAAAVNPRFVFVMVPRTTAMAPPSVVSTGDAAGRVVYVSWPNGKTDILVINWSGAVLSRTLTVVSGAAARDTAADRIGRTPPGYQSVVETDAETALLRYGAAGIERYVLSRATTLVADGASYASIADGPATLAFSGTEIDIDRYDADFSLYAPGVTDVFYRGQRIPVAETNGYLTRDPVSSVPDGGVPRGPAVRAYPNPFNPVSTVDVAVERDGRVVAEIFDAKGRLVKSLKDGFLPAGVHQLRWNGDTDAGTNAASGVYFVKVTVGGRTSATKITLIR